MPIFTSQIKGLVSGIAVKVNTELGSVVDQWIKVARVSTASVLDTSQSVFLFSFSGIDHYVEYRHRNEFILTVRYTPTNSAPYISTNGTMIEVSSINSNEIDGFDPTSDVTLLYNDEDNTGGAELWIKVPGRYVNVMVTPLSSTVEAGSGVDGNNLGFELVDGESTTNSWSGSLPATIRNAGDSDDVAYDQIYGSWSDKIVGSLTLADNVIKASDGGTAITLDTSDNVTIGGALQVGGDVIKASDGGTAITLDTSSNVSLSAGLTVTGTTTAHNNIVLHKSGAGSDPFLQIGTSSSEVLEIQSNIMATDQQIFSADFITKTASGTADRGMFRFYVDQSLIATIADDGVQVSAGKAFNGPLVGDVTGDVAGNADTADVATRATNVTVTANNTTNETVYLTFVDGATGTQGIETDTNLSYNPNTNLLNVTGISGRATTINTTATSTSSTYYLTFVDNSSSQLGETLRVDSGLQYNPSTNFLTITGDARVQGGQFYLDGTSTSVGNSLYIRAHDATLATGDNVGAVRWSGSENGSNYNEMGYVLVEADENFVYGSNTGSRMKFGLCTNGSASVDNKMALGNDGILQIDGGLHVGTNISDKMGFGTLSTTLNANSNVALPANYLLTLRNDADTTGQGAGLGFQVATDADDVGAAIIHSRTGGQSKGTLDFYTKQNTTDGGTPSLSLKLGNKEETLLQGFARYTLGPTWHDYFLQDDGDNPDVPLPPPATGYSFESGSGAPFTDPTHGPQSSDRYHFIAPCKMIFRGVKVRLGVDLGTPSFVLRVYRGGDNDGGTSGTLLQHAVTNSITMTYDDIGYPYGTSGATGTVTYGSGANAYISEGESITIVQEWSNLTSNSNTFVKVVCIWEYDWGAQLS